MPVTRHGDSKASEWPAPNHKGSNQRPTRGLGFHALEMRRLGPAELEAERRLIEAAQRDSARFGALYERYVDAIYSFANHHTGSATQAAEVAAATFERAPTHVQGY